MKTTGKGSPRQKTSKTWFFKLIILLALTCLVTSCQATSVNSHQTVTIQELEQQPIGQTIIRRISLDAPSEQHTHWKSYPNINWVSQIALDRNGAIWTAGRGGITHWNPHNNSAETFSASDGIPGNDITALAIGIDNKLWFGTHSGQIVTYSNGIFTPLPGKFGDTIICLAVSPDGTLWIGTNRGMYSYDGKNLQKYSTSQGILDDSIQSITVTSQGAVWAGVMGGVSLFDGRNWKSIKLTKGEFISNILEAPDKTIWLTSARRLIHYDGQTWKTYPIEKTLGDIDAINIGPQGTIWLGSMASGLIRFDEENQRFIKYPVADISSMASDPNGGLWLGTYDKGIAFFEGRDLEFYQPENMPINNFITSSTLSADGSLWFGTDQGIAKFDGEKWQSYTTGDGLASNAILSMAASPDGSIWFGTEAGISHFDGISWKTYNSLDGLSSDRISAVAITRNGTVWSVSKNSLYQFDGTHWNPITLPSDVPINSVNAITAGADGSLWVITTMGVLRFNENNWMTMRFPGQESAACLATSDKGDVWIGTLESGIFYLDGKLWNQAAIENVQSVLIDQAGQVNVTTKTGFFSITGPYWRMYTKTEGLPSNTINKIVISGNGNVWAATDKGISNLNGKNAWINYSEQNGLGNDFVQTLVLDQQGRVWAGMPLGGISEYVP